MIVNSRLVEFGYELLCVYPYAYYKYLKGELDQTISGIDTKPLYFFSKDHKEEKGKRQFANICLLKHDKIPNAAIHRPELDWSKWVAPPLKDYYKDKAITFLKPTVCICNRYTREWNGDPVNYFNVDVLGKMFDILKDKYTIVYVSISGKQKYYDHNEEIKQGDYDIIRNEYNDSVKIIHDIASDHKISFNEAQLRVYAGCDKFISMNGGLGILTSYFGGDNIIYSKKCQEIGESVNSFKRWYYKLGGSRITHVSSYDELIGMINKSYVNNNPPRTYFLVNTHNAIFTKRKISSILTSDKFARIVVYASSMQTINMLKQYPCIIIPCLSSKVAKISLSALDVRSICKDGFYDIIDISNPKQINNIIQAPRNISRVRDIPVVDVDNDYGYVDVI